jgi:NADPH2:quinone reductase
MKALLCKAFGPPDTLILGEVPSREPGPTEVAIRVMAAGVNCPDTLLIQDKYQVKPPLPFAPGGEVAGIVDRVGSEVRKFKPGDRVMAYIIVGGFAEEVVVDAGNVLPMPASLDFVAAAAFTMTYGTSLYALRDRGQLARGETLLVLGAAGGVGLAAVEIGAALGARVIAAASSDDKLALCREHGAAEGINYGRENLRERIRDLTGDTGVDVVYDPVGGGYSEQALRGTAWGGRFLVVGFASGEIARVPLNLALLKGCSIVGVSWGGFLRRAMPGKTRHLEELARLADTYKLRPHVSATYPLERAAEALNAMAERRLKGKAVIVIGERS